MKRTLLLLLPVIAIAAPEGGQKSREEAIGFVVGTFTLYLLGLPIDA